MFSFFVLTAKAQFPAFPPSSVSSSKDRDQMMWQLGLIYPLLPSKLTDPNTPPNTWPSSASSPDGNWTDAAGHTITRSGHGLWNNYDDTPDGFFTGLESWRVGSYTPIDLLKMNDGTAVTSPDQWWNLRRPEILKDVREQVWGVIPPDSILPSVSWSALTSTGASGGIEYKQKTVTGTIDISRYPAVRNAPKISAVLRVPADATGPVPVMVVIGGGFWTPVDVFWGYTGPKGWGVCIFDCGALQPDNGAGLTSYLIGLCNKGNWRKPSDWGSLAAWSWGISRLIDFFETDSDVDATKIGVTGHSRNGKAALVAMAYEPRLAVAFPSCGGSLGTKMNRRHWGQDLENSGWDQEYHWVAGNFFKWMGPLNNDSYMPRKAELCPVDAHSLLSLCAPRPVFLNGGTQDSWTDPYGMYLTGVGATPVYELLGKQGLVMPDAKPRIDEGYISGDIAYRYHTGGHTDAPDWPAFLEFAVKTFAKSKPTTKVSVSTLEVGPSSHSTVAFDVQSNTNWRASSSETWLSVSPDSGSNDGTVTLTADENAADGARTETITLSAKDVTPKAIQVNQASAHPALSVSATALSVSSAANSSASFNVVSNTVWTVSNPQAWLTASPASGINDRRVTLVAEVNLSTASRTATVTVSAEGVPSATVAVTQSGAAPTLTVSKTTLNIDATAGSKASFDVTSNTDWTLVSSESWLTASPDSGSMNGTVTITAEGNPDAVKRTAKITVLAQGTPVRNVKVT